MGGSQGDIVKGSCSEGSLLDKEGREFMTVHG